MEKFHCVRVYANGDAKETVRDKAGMEGWLEYNRKSRPGNTLFVNACCAEQDYGYLKLKDIMCIQATLEAELQHRVPALSVDTIGLQYESSTFGSFSRTYTGYRPEPDRMNFKKEIAKAEKEQKLEEAEAIERSNLAEQSRTRTAETDPDHSIIGHDYKAYCNYDNVLTNFICDAYDPQQGFWMTRQDAPEERRQDKQGKWRRNVSERAIDRTYHHDWNNCRHKLCKIEPA